MGPWADRLQPASFRGCGFAVLESNIITGRRTALHEYPFRDDVWVEDLGRAVRAHSFRAFVVGDDVYDQRDNLKKACETEGAGLLVHPSLGSLTCVVMSFNLREVAESGRVVEFEISLVETAQPLYPATVASTQAAVGTAADSALGAIGQDFAAKIEPALLNGAQVVEKAAATASEWTENAETLAGNVSLLVHSVAGLQGNYGRYSSGALGKLQDATATVTGLLSGAVVARSAVIQASSAANALAAAL